MLHATEKSMKAEINKLLTVANAYTQEPHSLIFSYEHV